VYVPAGEAVTVMDPFDSPLPGAIVLVFRLIVTPAQGSAGASSFLQATNPINKLKNSREKVAIVLMESFV
jgi:hypothetical protein